MPGMPKLTGTSDDNTPTCRDCLDCGVGEDCYCATPRRAGRLVAIEPGGSLLVVPEPAGVTRGEVDELGGVAVASRRA